MASRAVAWIKDGGAEFADVLIAGERLTATGVAIGAEPIGYRLDYKLETDYGFTTLGLLVTARGTRWTRKLDLRRNRRGRWSIRTESEGNPDLPAPGGDTSLFSEALDCDLGLSPLTNSMPVLRHGLLQGGGPVDFLMGWVSVPDLGVHASRQRYTFVRPRVRAPSCGTNRSTANSLRTSRLTLTVLSSTTRGSAGGLSSVVQRGQKGLTV